MGRTPEAAAVSSIFWPCSSAPVRKKTCSGLGLGLGLRLGLGLGLGFGSREQEGLSAVRAVVAREDVGADPLVRVAHVRRAWLGLGLGLGSGFGPGFGSGQGSGSRRRPLA